MISLKSNGINLKNNLNPNQSMISLKSNGINLKKNYDCYDNRENNDSFVGTQNERTNNHCCHFCNCCGCCGCKNFLINITPVNGDNNSLMGSCQSLYNSQNMII